ncbi:hypothetical protein ACRAWD_02820 [Caulobacter segnis]
MRTRLLGRHPRALRRGRLFRGRRPDQRQLRGTLPWRDVETPAAQAAGGSRGAVAVAAHHGMFDATGADVVRAVESRAPGSSRSERRPSQPPTPWSAC